MRSGDGRLMYCATLDSTLYDGLVNWGISFVGSFWTTREADWFRLIELDILGILETKVDVLS